MISFVDQLICSFLSDSTVADVDIRALAGGGGGGGVCNQGNT